MGKDASGKGTILGSERHTGGIMSFPVCLEKKAHLGGQGSQGPGWSSLLQQEGFCRPLLLSSIPGSVSNREVRETAFFSIGQPAQGHRTGLSCLYLTLLSLEENHCVAFLFDVLSAQLTCWCSWTASVYLELTFKR